MTVLTAVCNVCKLNAISHNYCDSEGAGDGGNGCNGSWSHRASTGHSEALGSLLGVLTFHADILYRILFQSMVKGGLNLDQQFLKKSE